MTRKQALKARHGDILHHKKLKNSDDTPTRCRVNGKCKTWKTRPTHFRLPVKYGLKLPFYIDQDNRLAWIVT